MALDKKKVTIEKAGGVATCSYDDESAFFDTDLPKTQIKEVFAHTNQYVASCGEMAAELATDIMSKDKKIDEVIITMPYGVSKRDSVTAKARREVTYPGMNGNPSVTRSDLQLTVKTGVTKMSKTVLKGLRSKMTEALLS